MTLYYESELYHHGIKGQKWGVRRFQNPDGTRTELGKKYYAKAEKQSEKRMKKYYKTAKKASSARMAQEEALAKADREANKFFGSARKVEKYRAEAERLSAPRKKAELEYRSRFQVWHRLYRWDRAYHTVESWCRE